MFKNKYDQLTQADRKLWNKIVEEEGLPKIERVKDH